METIGANARVAPRYPFVRNSIPSNFKEFVSTIDFCPSRRRETIGHDHDMEFRGVGLARCDQRIRDVEGVGSLSPRRCRSVAGMRSSGGCRVVAIVTEQCDRAKEARVGALWLCRLVGDEMLEPRGSDGAQVDAVNPQQYSLTR